MNVKKYLLFLPFCLIGVLFISCSDEDVTPPEDPLVPNTKLAVTNSNECLMFKTMTGSSDGGIEDLGKELVEERLYNSLLKTPVSPIGVKGEDCTLTFIGDTDSLIVTGYINCDYHEDFITYGMIMVNSELKCKYKFEEDGALMLDLEEGESDRWVLLGHGDKEKIEVYLKVYQIHYSSEEGDYYYWESVGTYCNVVITSSPDEAKDILDNPSWDKFFEEKQKWKFPAWPRFEEFQSPQDIKVKSTSLGWAVYKMTYLPTTTEKEK